MPLGLWMVITAEALKQNALIVCDGRDPGTEPDNGSSWRQTRLWFFGYAGLQNLSKKVRGKGDVKSLQLLPHLGGADYDLHRFDDDIGYGLSTPSLSSIQSGYGNALDIDVKIISKLRRLT